MVRTPSFITKTQHAVIFKIVFNNSRNSLGRGCKEIGMSDKQVVEANIVCNTSLKNKNITEARSFCIPGQSSCSRCRFRTLLFPVLYILSDRCQLAFRVVY